MGMQSIKNSFISEITQSATIAVGASVVLQLGINNHQKIATNHPNATLRMGAGLPGTVGVRAIQLAPTHHQIQNILSNNRDILFELYLTELIQHWFDFLGDVYKKAISDNLSGATQYSIPVVKIKVNFALTGSSLNQSLVDSACGDFSFLSAPDKLKTVRKILRVDLASVVNDVALIKENIQVRNILQHRGGIISSGDLADLGVTSITEDHGNSTKAIVAGQKVTRTGFDIENLVNSLTTVSSTLIP